MKRLTKKIKNRYCGYDLKDAPYKDMFGFYTNSEIEDYVPCDLTLAVDKLGAIEDLFRKYKIKDLKHLEGILKDVTTITYNTLKKQGKLLERMMNSHSVNTYIDVLRVQAFMNNPEVLNSIFKFGKFEDGKFVLELDQYENMINYEFLRKLYKKEESSTYKGLRDLK